MPYFKISMNKLLSGEQKHRALKSMHQLVVEALKKPDRFVMTSIADSQAMHFGLSDDPVAFVEFKSIGLTDTKALSAAICDLIMKEFDIEPDRVYIEFVDEPRHMFGHNRTTFEK